MKKIIIILSLLAMVSGCASRLPNRNRFDRMPEHQQRKVLIDSLSGHMMKEAQKKGYSKSRYSDDCRCIATYIVNTHTIEEMKTLKDAELKKSYLEAVDYCRPLSRNK